MEEAVHSSRLVRFGTFEVDLRCGRTAQRRSEAETHRPALSGSRHPAGAPRRGGDAGGIAEAAVAGHLCRCRSQPEYSHQQDSRGAGRLGGKPALCRNFASARVSLYCAGRGYARLPKYLAAQAVRQESRMPWVRRTSILFVVLVLLAAAGFFIYKRLQSPHR